MPMTPFIGVRISWLIVARNSDFRPGRLDGPVARHRQRFGGLAPLGDVLEDDDRPHHLALLRHGGTDVLDRQTGAVAAPEHFGVDAGDAAFRERGVHRALLGRIGPAVGARVVHHLVDGLAQQLVVSPPQHLGRRRVHEAGAALGVDATDSVGGRCEDELVLVADALEGAHV